MHSRLEQGGYEYRDEDWEGLVQEYMHDIHYTTMLEAGATFVHAMIGPAVVALPFAVLQVRFDGVHVCFCAISNCNMFKAGLGIYALLLLLLALICDYTSRMLIKVCSKRTRKSWTCQNSLASESDGCIE